MELLLHSPLLCDVGTGCHDIKRLSGAVRDEMSGYPHHQCGAIRPSSLYLSRPASSLAIFLPDSGQRVFVVDEVVEAEAIHIALRDAPHVGKGAVHISDTSGQVRHDDAVD